MPIVLQDAAEGGLSAGAQAAGELGPKTDPYRLAQRALRGRVVLAVTLSLVLGTIGGLVGWKKGKLIYRSEGLVRVAGAVPTAGPVNEARTTDSTFEAFLQSQQALLSSQRIVDAAMREPVWQATGMGQSAIAATDFADGVRVEHRPGTDFLRIFFVGRDPLVAVSAVNSVIDAYQRIYQEQQDDLQRQTLKTLRDHQTTISGRLASLRTQMRTASQEIGPSGMERIFESAVRQVTTLESTLTDIQIALVLSRNQETVPATAQQIASRDEGMRRLLERRNEYESLLRQARLRHYGENHAVVVQARDGLEQVNREILSYAKEIQANGTPQAPLGAQGSPGAVVFVGQPVAKLRENEEGIRKLHEEARQRMMMLGAQRSHIEALKAEIDRADSELESLQRQIQTLQVQSSGFSGSLSIISRGEKPTAPFQDRRLATAGMAAGIGAAAPLALLLLLGLLSTRYRFSDETESDLASRATLLGILPTLSGELNDPSRMDAAQCVHHIRVMLQVKGGQDGQKTYLVTSASAGEGKTSLITALAFSYAASGSRTLLVDADFVGQRLTQGFNAEGMPGLHEALTAKCVNGFAKASGQRNLWVLPAGHVDALSAGTLSANAVKRLLEETAARYDVVLIDSGPILGSVEASVIAAQVDGVILTIARRQQKPLVERAVRRLDDVAAKLAGVVFNHANRADFFRSVSSGSLRSASVKAGAVAPSTGAGVAPPDLGPLVGSVTSTLPAAESRSAGA